MEQKPLPKTGTKVIVSDQAPYHAGVVGEVEFYSNGDTVAVLFINKGPGSRTYIAIDSRHAIPL